MKLPAELKPACWGAVGGAVALAIIGFSWGGWVTGTTAETNARERAAAAVVTVLAPICAEKFRQTDDAAQQLVDLKKVRSWEQSTFIEKGGWATMPGMDQPAPGVANKCAQILGEQT